MCKALTRWDQDLIARDRGRSTRSPYPLAITLPDQAYLPPEAWGEPRLLPFVHTAVIDLSMIVVISLIQVYSNAGLAYWLSRRFGVAWCVAAPAASIGASNFFELAVAREVSS